MFHIGIKRLQFLLLKISLLLGVNFKFNTTFVSVKPPKKPDLNWGCVTKPALEEELLYNVLVCADGESCILSEQLKFKRKAFKASLALGITGNFKNLHKPEDVDKREFGLSSQYRKAWFDDLYKKTGIRLENVTYYRDETHYFVATANKGNLLDYGVLLKHHTDINELLHPSNIDKTKLEQFIREFAEYCNIPKDREFATNQRGKPDIAIFDFTTKWYNTYSTKIFETATGNRLLAGMVGDSLLGPFWPQGTGCNRAFLSAHDFAWSVYNFLSQDPIELLSERETAYRLCFASEDGSIKQPYHNIKQDPKSVYKAFVSVKKCEDEQYDKELFSSKDVDLDIPKPVVKVEPKIIAEDSPLTPQKQKMMDIKNKLKENVKLIGLAPNLQDVLKSPFSHSSSPMKSEFEMGMTFEDELEQIFKQKKNLTEMIDKLQNNDVEFTKLEINGEEVVDTVVKIICSYLKRNNTLQSLIISDSNITNASIDYLSKMIAGTTTLREFKLTNNANDIDVSKLISSLQENKSIKSFILDEQLLNGNQKNIIANSLKRNAEMKNTILQSIVDEAQIVSSPIDPYEDDIRISPRINKKDIHRYSFVVKEFTKDMYDMSKDKISYIIDCVKKNDENLKIVDLKDRGIDDEEATQILKALEKNTNVTQLNLMENSIQGDCIDEIIALIKNNKTIEKLDFAGNNIPMKKIERMIVALKNYNSTLIQFSGGKKESEFQSKVIEKLMDRNYKLKNKTQK